MSVWCGLCADTTPVSRAFPAWLGDTYDFAVQAAHGWARMASQAETPASGTVRTSAEKGRQTAERASRADMVLTRRRAADGHPLPGDPLFVEQDELYDHEGESFVYFISAGDDAVKIGISVNPALRLIALQTAHHQTLTLLLEIPGAEAEEARLHQRFRSSHIRGEWFRLSAEIREFIAAKRAELAAAEDALDYGWPTIGSA